MIKIMRYRGRKNISSEELANVNVLLQANIINKIKDVSQYSKVLLELGAGRGSFTINLAKNNSETLVVAIEKSRSFANMLGQNVLDHNLGNVIVVCDDVMNLLEWFELESIDGIYLNFSDPWPKKKHHKRRLTFPRFLNIYNQLLKKDGFIQFRTDHFELFIDSVEYLEQYDNFIVQSVDFNLALSDLYSDYEIVKREKYKINQVIAVKVND